MTKANKKELILLIIGAALLIAAAAWLTSQGVGLLEKKLCPWKRSIENL